MRRVSTSEARKELAELINRVAYARERVLIGRRGKELAALIPIADLCLLESLAEAAEDRLDAEDAHRNLADAGDELDRSDSAQRELNCEAVHRQVEPVIHARP